MYEANMPTYMQHACTIHMQHACSILATHMLRLCNMYAHICHMYATYMLCICYIHAMYMLRTCYIHATYMHHTCYIHATYMQHTHNIHCIMHCSVHCSVHCNMHQAPSYPRPQHCRPIAACSTLATSLPCRGIPRPSASTFLIQICASTRASMSASTRASTRGIDVCHRACFGSLFLGLGGGRHRD